MDYIELLDEEAPAAQPTIPSKIGGSLAGLGASLLGGAAKTGAGAFDVALALGEKFPQPQVSETGEITTSQLTPEQYESLQLTPKAQAKEAEYREKLPEPLNFPGEKLINKAAESLPGFYATGGGFINAAARALGSEGGRELAKQYGYGELGQFIGSLAGAGIAAGTLTPKDLTKLEQVNYNQFSKSIPTGATQELVNGQRVYDQLLKNEDLLPETSKWLGENLKNVEPLLKSGAASLSDAFQKMKFVNKLIRKVAPTEEIKQALQSISSAMKSDIIAAGRKYPELYTKGLIEGSSISFGMNNLSPLRAWLRKYVNPKTIGTSIAGTVVGQQPIQNLLGFTPMAVGGGIGLGIGARGLTEAIETLGKSPAALRHVLGTTVPQVVGGALATRPRTQPQMDFIELVD